jgi:hypothetical protein
MLTLFGVPGIQGQTSCPRAAEVSARLQALGAPRPAAGGVATLLDDPEGVRLAGPAARRDEGEYSAYLTEEQRSARFGDGRLCPRAARAPCPGRPLPRRAPWVVHSSGQVSHKSTASATDGGWDTPDILFDLPGADVGINNAGALVWPWITASSIYVWNQQPSLGDVHGPERNLWQNVCCTADRVSVGPAGPWLIQSPSGSIWHLLK